MKTPKLSRWNALCVSALFVAGLLLTPQAGYARQNAGASNLSKEIAAIFKAYGDEIMQARRAGEETPDYAHHPALKYIPKLKKIATEARGTEVAAKAVCGVFELAASAHDYADAKAALQEMEADYSRSPSMFGCVITIQNDPLLAPAVGWDLTERAVRQFSTLASNAETKSYAKIALAQLLLNSPDGKKAPVRAEAIRLADEVYQEPPNPPYDMNRKMAQGLKFETLHLQMGMPAPDFEIEDSQGVKFKLSDYRGKVVVLDFWGFW